ncbi:uncharacterized protein LOC122320311 [Drosophila ficusphila]|uniref:uncharacterized protein LOC122320311 n=1 Tax=Drosophila ficusphila TaxID=30025 RepID=UPI001C890851|nr:uncharacterized protein LOC122320311 [Drosophila ficusphila]
MLLVFFDAFTKWIELIPLRKATSASLIRAFRERGIGVELQYTAPYCPRENPTERANRTIKTMISQYLGDQQNTWDTLSPEITLALNSSVSDSTGYSPAFLLQGREPRLPKTWYEQVTPGTGTAPQTPTQRADHLREIYSIVQGNIQRASKDQGRQYNLRRREWRPVLGSFVLVRQHHLSKASEGFAAKLAPKFDGPYKVVAFTSPNIVSANPKMTTTKTQAARAYLFQPKKMRRRRQVSTGGDYKHKPTNYC